MKNTNHLPSSDVVRFSMVGVLATVTYFVVSNFLIYLELLDFKPCSVLAYLAGMIVSHLGQKLFSFRMSGKIYTSMAKFCLLSLIGLSISYGDEVW